MKNQTPIETWKAIPGFPMFEVSTLGRCRRIRWNGGGNTRVKNRRMGKPVVLKPIAHKSSHHDYKVAYLIWKLWDQNALQSVTRSSARLILETFTGSKDPSFVPKAINGDITDMRLVNLIWTKRSPAKLISGVVVQQESNQNQEKVSQDTIKT